jgi:hypothetical protein
MTKNVKDVVRLESGADVAESIAATSTESPPSAESVDHNNGDLAVLLNFSADSRTLEFHGVKVDISSIVPAGLIYLIGLGYSTSLTQCNAGVATAMRDEGKSQAEIDKALAENREERCQKICDGSITKRGGGQPKKALDSKLLDDMAWAGLQVIYKRNGAALPNKPGEKAVAIANYLTIPHNRTRCENMVKAMMEIGDDA